jgi:hypothetical protein
MIDPDGVGPEAGDLLWRAGWRPDRRVETIAWVGRLMEEGFLPNPLADSILESLGGLSVPIPAAGINPYDHELRFEPVRAATGDRDRAEAWETALGIHLFPLGEEIRTGNVMWIGDDGKIYYGREFGLYLIGESFREAMDRLVFMTSPLVLVAD